MARAETLARARNLERPDLAYLTRFPAADGPQDTELTRTELARDTEWIAARLREHGLVPGQRALLTVSGFEGFWAHAMIGALRSMRIPYGIAEAMGWDHRRTAVFQRELRPHAVIGLTAETLEGLAGTADIGEMFRSTAVVLARPEAVTALRRASVPAFVMCALGPALALECPQRCGAHVNAGEWRFTERDGQLVVESQKQRESRLDPTPLGIAGRVVDDRCACGSEDPRVLLGAADTTSSSRS